MPTQLGIKFGGIRAARLEASPRLQAVLRVLVRGGWWSAREIRIATGDIVEAVPTAVQELKANGVQIEPSRYLLGKHCWRLVPDFDVDGFLKERGIGGERD